MNGTINVVTHFSPTMYEQAKPPLVSLYLPTHRYAPENQQDRIRFKNLTTEAEASLALKYNKREYEGIVANLTELADNPNMDVWRFSKDGLAVLANNDSAYVYRLDYPVDELAVVADSYHVKPLIRNFQYGSHYFLLALASDKFDLYYGDFHSLEPVEMPDDIAKEFKEVFDDFGRGSDSVKVAHGSHPTFYFGYTSKASVADVETEKFFHYVDKAITNHLLRGSACPVILVSLPEHQAAFRKIATIPHLLEQSIESPAESMSETELVGEAAAIIRDIQMTHIQKIVDEFGQAQAKGRGSANFETIADALAEKKVLTLFVEEDRLVPGTFDEKRGELTYGSIDDPDVDDLIDDFAQSTYLQGGSVYVLDAAMMPSASGVAALFRY